MNCLGLIFLHNLKVTLSPETNRRARGTKSASGGIGSEICVWLTKMKMQRSAKKTLDWCLFKAKVIRREMGLFEMQPPIHDVTGLTIDIVVVTKKTPTCRILRYHFIV